VLTATYSSGSEVPLSISNFTATGKDGGLHTQGTLAPGSDLMVVQNTGLGFLNGAFR